MVSGTYQRKLFREGLLEGERSVCIHVTSEASGVEVERQLALRKRQVSSRGRTSELTRDLLGVLQDNLLMLSTNRCVFQL